jgi:thiosulfate/3-mercaptopyruvate sulfurtransferase
MTRSLFAFAVVVFLPGTAAARSDGYPRPELLVEAADLMKEKGGKPTRILDARARTKYQAGHVPGAVWVDHATWSVAFKDGQDREAWARRIGAQGIDVGTRVVIYDDNLSKDAARIWWILRYWGVKDVRLLNGGWGAWTAAKGVVEKTSKPPQALDPKLKADAGRLATKEQIKAGLKDKPQIVDARSEGEHCGTATTAKRNGSIPGALPLEWSDTLNKKTGRFKTADELTKLFRDAGIDPTKPATTYCQSGGRAAVMAFALELMGGKDVRNYYRSWAEWGNADDTPVIKPKKK